MIWTIVEVGLALVAGALFVAGLIRLAKGARSPYFRLRQKILMDGWKWVGLSLLLIGLAGVIWVYQTPASKKPEWMVTATPTLTATATATTTTATATASATATPVHKNAAAFHKVQHGDVGHVKLLEQLELGHG